MNYTQLKSLAKTTEIRGLITNVINNTELSGIAIKQKLKDIGRSYTTETLKAAIAQSTLNKQHIKTIMHANGLRGELLKTTVSELENAIATNKVTKEQGKAAASTIGLGDAFTGLRIEMGKALASLKVFLTTNPLGWLTMIGGAIAAVAVGINLYEDSVEKARKKARERTDELFDEFQQQKEQLAGHKKTVAELAARYDELAKGVDLSDNRNVSLSTGEYEEFLNISERLADSFPELSKGIDENGNSILTLGTKGMTAKEQLEDLLRTEEDLNNFRIAQGLEDAFKGVYTYIEDADKASAQMEESLGRANERINGIREISENGIDLDRDTGLTISGPYTNRKRENLIFSGEYQNESDRDYMDALKESAKNFYESLSAERQSALRGMGITPNNFLHIQQNTNNGTFDIYASLFELTDDELTSLQNIIHDNLTTAVSALEDEYGAQEQEAQDIILKGENAWKDFIPNLAAGMQSKPTFQGLEPDLQDIAVKIVEGLDSGYAEAMDAYDPDPYAYIRDKLIVPMSDLSDSDKKKLAECFADLFRLDPLDISEGNREKIRIAMEQITGILGETPFEFRTILGFDVSDDTKKRLNTSIRQITDDHGIANRNEYQKLNEYTKNFTSAQAELWLEATLGAHDAEEAIRLYETALAEASRVSVTPQTPLSISETVQQIDTRLRSAFNSLRSAYQEIFTPDEATGETRFSLDSADITDKFKPILDALESLDELDGISIDYSAFDDFVSVLTDTSSTEADVQAQFDSLATSILYTSDCTNMSVETFNLLAGSLSEMGVSNAHEVLEDLLALQQSLAAAGVDAQTAMSGEANTLRDLGLAGTETAEQLMAYYIQKQFAENPLTTLNDILQLENLCNALGVTGEMLETVTRLKLAFEARENGTHSADLDKDIENYQKRILELAGSYGTYSFEFGSVGTKAGFSSSGSRSRSAAETFDWTAQAIENVENEIKALDEIAKSSYSTLSQKNEALTQELRKVSEEIDLQQQAYNTYMQKAEAVGLSGHYKDLAQNGAPGMEDITDETLKNQISEYQKWYEKAQSVSNKLKALNTNMKDIYASAYGLQTDHLKEQLDSNSITQKQYLKSLKDAYEKFYTGLDGFAQQYHDAVLDYLSKEKDYLNDVAGAAASLADTEINKIQKAADSQESMIQEQIGLLEAKKEPLQEELDALEEKAQRENLILNLQKAQYELARSENQRTKLLYKNGQMVYESDSESIRDAQKSIDDANLEIQKQSIQDQIDALDEEIDGYNDLIDQINKAADTQISALEQIKNKWQEVADGQEHAKNLSLLTDEFGVNAIGKILSGYDDDLFAQWKSNYINTLAGIDVESQGYIGDMTQQIASLYNIDLSSLQAQFQNVTDSISAVKNASGSAASAIGFYTNVPALESNNDHTPDSNGSNESLSCSVTNLGVISNETLPNVTSNMDAIGEAALSAASEVSNVAAAIENMPESKDVTISIHTVSGNIAGGISSKVSQIAYTGNAYADGTRHAKKGLAVIGEEKPEIVITNNQKAFIAQQPTLLSMKGGETVYNGEETARILKAKGFRPITPDEFPLLKAFQKFSPDDIMQKFAPNLSYQTGAISSAIARNVSNVNDNSVNRSSVTLENVHIHCPGVTKDEVAKQIGAELNNVFNGLSLRAYQRASITR